MSSENLIFFKHLRVEKTLRIIQCISVVVRKERACHFNLRVHYQHLLRYNLESMEKICKRKYCIDSR